MPEKNSAKYTIDSLVCHDKPQYSGMRYCSSFVWLLTMFMSLNCMGQVQVNSLSLAVSKSGSVLDYPFAAGLNSPQFHSADLDNDGDQDLVMFDRSSEIIACFENLSDHYQFKPEWSNLFPANLQHWIQLADYDCDGRQDLFTFTNIGVAVYQNTSTNGLVQWELTSSPLRTEGVAGPVNVLFNATDISLIKDIDQDGDLDFIFFNFSNGDFIEYHKNWSMERTGTCGLILELESGKYGELEVCGCGEYGFDSETCHASERKLHIAGKSILALDQNSDGLMDLVIGQEGCSQLDYLQNSGTISEPLFLDAASDFPLSDGNNLFSTFMAAYYLDVTFDGLSDMLVAPNIRTDNSNHVNLQSSVSLFTNQGSNSYSSRQGFLQNQMIDVGEKAFPSIVDINGDGQNDLVIGNRIGGVSGEFAGLTYYESTASGLLYQTDDLFGLKQLEFSELSPQFVDANSDGTSEMVVKAIRANGEVFFILYQNLSSTGVSINVESSTNINFPIKESDDFYLVDMNHDEHIDLLVSDVFGELNYYQGTGEVGSFVLSEEDMLSVEPSSDNANRSIAMADFNRDGIMDLITTSRSGKCKIYHGFPDNTSQAEEIVLEDTQDALRLGRFSKPAIGELSGESVIMFGTHGGGLLAYSAQLDSDSSEVSLEVFPNPSYDGIYTFRSSLNGSFGIYDLSGNHILSENQFEGLIRVDLSGLERGVYIARVLGLGRSITTKVLIMPGLDIR